MQQSDVSPSLLFVLNDAKYFLSHRLGLANAARGAGYKVSVAAPDHPVKKEILAHGFTFHAIPLSRRGMNPFAELKTFISLISLYKACRPDIIHHLTIKPVLYGSMAARFSPQSSVVNSITGMGYVFVAGGFLANLRRKFVELLYRFALSGQKVRVVVQNNDDREYFICRRLVSQDRLRVILGSGVDVDEFAYVPPPQSERPIVVLAARMLWDKGVGEFVQAAELLRKQGSKARCVIVGDVDNGNPASISKEQLQRWNASGVVEWWGWRDDMKSVLAQADIVCLPSYREGVPRVLIEAAAIGRPIVATDAPGCREIVRDGENGFLVPVKNGRRLFEALGILVTNPDLRKTMGEKGRQLVCDEFSLKRVNDETLKSYVGIRQ